VGGCNEQVADHDGHGTVTGYVRVCARTSLKPSDTIDGMQELCSEFLVHAADVEGLCQGIDQDLVAGALTCVWTDAN
jgi:phosphoribosylformimino-5-aminoimidazole carboxamide ribonucleotide (ProFAR) isomerase